MITAAVPQAKAPTISPDSAPSRHSSIVRASAPMIGTSPPGRGLTSHSSRQRAGAQPSVASEAATHGTGDTAADTRPLLVIAGAGSGKTNTLAHRVANLVRHGADPQRMLLLTFSRRAAQEMERRVGGVLQKALGLQGTQPLPNLPWSGTFHGIGARLLRGVDVVSGCGLLDFGGLLGYRAVREG